MTTTPDEPDTPPAAAGGPLSLPDEWVGMPPRRTEAPPPTSGHPSAGSDWPAATAPSGSHNSRAVVAAVLGGLATAGAVAAWVGAGFVPLLGILGLGIAGIVLSSMALVSVRRGLATNRGLAVAGLAMSIAGVVGVVGLYAAVLLAVAAVLDGVG